MLEENLNKSVSNYPSTFESQNIQEDDLLTEDINQGKIGRALQFDSPLEMQLQSVDETQELIEEEDEQEQNQEE